MLLAEYSATAAQFTGEKIRTVQFQAAGLVSPSSLFFAPRDRLLVTPGCYEFTVR